MTSCITCFTKLRLLLQEDHEQNNQDDNDKLQSIKCFFISFFINTNAV